ncbi:hypothetical protein NQ317_018872 [Molorchus minor]|uniref:THAP-type domain-containing protein n=1 Tax=Molorchus minor TaxID=1323400 RepID=A0ABQ9JEW7_9CUCU|nr:hypothetical protein NQ317_019819 [Molorchus minor]KAJ8976765.1 hypothetical protein NQ317_018872 [Molorchus minor]
MVRRCQVCKILDSFNSEFSSTASQKTSRRRIWLCLRGFGGDQPLPNLAYPCLSHFKPEDILISSTACLVDQVLQSVEKEVNLILFSPLHP